MCDGIREVCSVWVWEETSRLTDTQRTDWLAITRSHNTSHFPQLALRPRARHWLARFYSLLYLNLSTPKAQIVEELSTNSLPVVLKPGNVATAQSLSVTMISLDWRLHNWTQWSLKYYAGARQLIFTSQPNCPSPWYHRPLNVRLFSIFYGQRSKAGSQ